MLPWPRLACRQGQVPEGLYYVQEGFVDLIYMPSEKKLVSFPGTGHA